MTNHICPECAGLWEQRDRLIDVEVKRQAARTTIEPLTPLPEWQEALDWIDRQIAEHAHHKERFKP